MNTAMWEQMKGKVKQQWAKLTDDDLRQLESHAEELGAKLQQRYGFTREDAERQAKDFRNRNNWN
ncbi:MAG TPA: CsbD family protein [Steroidobacteraceae bacterium]|nr:CsbD family protein [Steroidobacteraceae bacterium]